MFYKNTARTLTFDLTDTSGTYLTGKTVTATISKDGGAFAAAAGAVTEIGSGVYAFAGTAADFNCDTFALRFVATGARDVFLHGTTEADYTAAKAGFIDVAVSSRLASASYTAPTAAPSATDNASAVRTNLATELGRIDATVSSRLAGDTYTAPSAAPSATDNAAAVRTNLSTELSRLDVAISTRNAIAPATPTNVSDAQTAIVAALPAAAPTTTAIVAAIKADAEWKTVLAGVNGTFTYNPATGVLVLKDKDGVTTRATLTATTNSDGIVTARASA